MKGRPDEADGLADRRPLAVRGTGWAQAAARRLAATSVTPNRISFAGMVAALLAGALLAFGGTKDGAVRATAFVIAALLCQVRLLCNLFDGMVAVEGGKSTPDGGVWNEVPDRVSDVAILVGCGAAVGIAWLGWMAASAALATAYVREHGRALGQPSDFSGPMAKQHRMALVTVAAPVAGLWPFGGDGDAVLIAALWAIAVGGALTAGRRLRSLVRRLNAGAAART